jgi:two-component system nitrate/nitrite response regulator NarL
VPRTNHHALAPADKSASAPGVANVLIAEARAMSADTMVRAINRVVGLRVSSRCASRREVAAACAITPPDVAVLDLGLYQHDARYAVSSLRKQATTVKVLLMIPELDDDQLAKALMAGAGNCISVNAGAHDFVQTVRATAAGRSILAPELQQRAVRLIAELSDGESCHLSPRECEVLRLIAAGLSIDDVASQLFITINTARTHLYRSYRKLGAKNRIGAVGSAVRRGLLH